MPKELESFDKNPGVSGVRGGPDGINGVDPWALEVERLRVDAAGDIVRARSTCERDAMLMGVGGICSVSCDVLAIDAACFDRACEGARERVDCEP